jgi:hypothetical protein
MKIESNYSYLRDASVVDAGEVRILGNPRPGMARCTPGRWMTAIKNFRFHGGCGGYGLTLWGNEGVDIKAGQRFRLLEYGCPDCASIWEVEDA